MNQSKLRFRIAYFSSEDREYPAAELLKHGKQNRGWQSGRFPEYPQVLILEFIRPVCIQQLQFLSHQSKISSKIELHTYLPEDTGTFEAIENFSWKRQGYLSLDTNESSRFQARELKSINMDVNAQFVKIILNKPYANVHNVFAQVSLITINVLGEELGGQSSPSNDPSSQFENDTDLDPVTNEKIKLLMDARERAIEEQNHVEANRLKDTIEQLRGTSQNRSHLEEPKKLAIANEDLDKANILKIEIDRMRNAVALSAGELVFSRPSSAKVSGGEPANSYDERAVHNKK